jgi:hypothetical protein
MEKKSRRRFSLGDRTATARRKDAEREKREPSRRPEGDISKGRHEADEDG